MISFHYEIDFHLEEEEVYRVWIHRILSSEGFETGDIGYIFCDDQYLRNLHKEYLKNDLLTDIITFDYTEGHKVSGDIFISVERVRDNFKTFNTDFSNELKRVMAHGLLHMMGYGDKAEVEIKRMRNKEEEKIGLFHVEH